MLKFETPYVIQTITLQPWGAASTRRGALVFKSLAKKLHFTLR
jgi:hypothetical protein